MGHHRKVPRLAARPGQNRGARATFKTYQTYYKPEHVLPVSDLLGPVTVGFVPVVAFGP